MVRSNPSQRLVVFAAFFAAVSSSAAPADEPAPRKVVSEVTSGNWLLAVPLLQATSQPPIPLASPVPALRASLFSTRSENSSLLFLSPLSPLRAVLRVAVLQTRASLTTTVQAAEGEEPPVPEPAETSVRSAETDAAKRAAVLRHRRRSVLNDRERERGELRADASGVSTASSFDVEGIDGRIELLALPSTKRPDTTDLVGAGRVPDGSGSLHLSGQLTDALRFTVTGLAAETASTTWRAGATFDLELDDQAFEAGVAFGTRFQSNVESQRNQIDRRSVGALSLRHVTSLGDSIRTTWGARVARAEFLATPTRVDPEFAIVFTAPRGNPGDDAGSFYARVEGEGDSLFPGQEVISGDAPIALSEGLPVFAPGLDAQRTWRAGAALGHENGDWRVEARVRNEVTRNALLVTPSDLAGAPFISNAARPRTTETALFAERTFASGQAQAGIEYAYGRFAHVSSDPRDLRGFHRVTTRIDAYSRRTGTAIMLFHRLHEGAPVVAKGSTDDRVREHRYLVELRQDVPWVPSVVGADMAVLVALRNVYYDDVDRRAVDEFALSRAPRKLTGGIRVKF